jgi:hypothetical protein
MTRNVKFQIFNFKDTLKLYFYSYTSINIMFAKEIFKMFKIRAIHQFISLNKTKKCLVIVLVSESCTYKENLSLTKFNGKIFSYKLKYACYS